MFHQIKTKNYIYNFHNEKNDTPTLVIMQRSKTVFENDAILKVLTGKNALITYFKALDLIKD